MKISKKIIATIFIFTATSTFAETRPGESRQTLTVIGNWLDNENTEELVLNHPGARTLITEKNIQQQGSETLAEALKGIPGLQVRDSNGTGGSDVSLNIGLRGLTTRLSPRSTILMDGIPLSVAPYGQPQLSMAPLSIGNISSIDVIRGASAVRYGPQNVGGIINFSSRAIPKNFSSGINAQTEGSRHGGPKTLTSAYLGGTADNGLGAVLLYSGLHGKGYRKNNHHVDIDDIMLKTQYQISPTDQLFANFHYYNGKAGMPGGLSEAQYAEDPFQSTRPFDVFFGQRRDVSLKYKHQQNDKQFELLAWHTNSFRGSNIEQDGITLDPPRSGQFRLRSFPRHYSVYAVEPSYSQRFFHRGISNEITAGYRFLKEKADEKAYRSAFYRNQQGLPATNFYQHSYGGSTAHALYIDDTINFSNWTLIPGIRYENIAIDSTRKSFTSAPDIRREKHYSEILPSLNLMYHINDAWKIYANAGTSFGSIQYFQLTQGGTGNNTAPGLSAEKARNYELGTRFNDTTWQAEITLFYIDFDNQLLLNGNEWTSLGATKHQGVEAAFNYDLNHISNALDGLSLYTTYSYTKAYAIHGAGANKDLPFYSRQIYTVGSRYEKSNWVFNLDSYAQSKQFSPNLARNYDISPSEDGRYGIIPGYMVWNLRAEYDFGTKFSNLKIAAGIKNLFDQQYFSRSTDNNFGKYAGQPRTFYLQTSFDF